MFATGHRIRLFVRHARFSNFRSLLQSEVVFPERDQWAFHEKMDDNAQKEDEHVCQIELLQHVISSECEAVRRLKVGKWNVDELEQRDSVAESGPRHQRFEGERTSDST